MNFEHAVQTIAKRGFTDRQARFLVLVARHSGVCVMRQYSSFAGIVFGQKTRKFFANLERARFVSIYDCAHSRGRVYHVRHRAIYEAIGEATTSMTETSTTSHSRAASRFGYSIRSGRSMSVHSPGATWRRCTDRLRTNGAIWTSDLPRSCLNARLPSCGES